MRGELEQYAEVVGRDQRQLFANLGETRRELADHTAPVTSSDGSGC